MKLSLFFLGLLFLFPACGGHDKVKPVKSIHPVKSGDPKVVKVVVKATKRVSKEGMVFIPEGTFPMSIDTEGLKFKTVKLSSYYIDEYEVSNKKYGEFIAAGGYKDKKYWSEEGWKWLQKKGYVTTKWWKSGRYKTGVGYPNYPVSGISWFEADAYARWAGKRLPTEAEWEKASRGTDQRKFPWGNVDIFTDGKYYANFETFKDGFIYSNQVDKFKRGKSPYGCYNMLGNVWEYVSGWAGNANYYKNMPLENPKGPKTGTVRLTRGGSWFKFPNFYISYYRLTLVSGSREYDDIGFRCVVDAK